MVADRVDSATSVSLMDLSVEAECFGSTIRYSDDEGSHRRGKHRVLRGGGQRVGRSPRWRMPHGDLH